MSETFDYIIAGGGSAGCVLAARLSERPSVKVLLLEAGFESSGPFFDVPAGIFRLMGNPRVDWLYRGEPDPTIGNRTNHWSAGRVLGGTSAMNGLVYMRGGREDFDDWVRAGASGWGWDDLLPYFTRAETCHADTPDGSRERGGSGPLQVSAPRSRHPLAAAFVAACVEAGLPANPAYCGGDVSGAYLVDSTTRAGRRSSAATAYLRPARSRANLTVVTGATVDRLLFDGRRAVGVRVLHKGQPREFRGRETIVSAGVIGSPAILLRSGIGPGEDIRDQGIEVIADLPGVGANFQEHQAVTVGRQVNVPTYNSPVDPLTVGKWIADYLLFRKGPLTSSVAQAMAGASSPDAGGRVDMLLSMLPLWMDNSGGSPRLAKAPGITIGVNTVRPKSTGRVRLRSPDPRAAPRIELGLLADEEDVRVLVAGLRWISRIFAAGPLAAHVVDRDPLPADEQGLAELVRSRCGIGYHGVGTCAMGSGPLAVLDETLRVRGVGNLRVVDASAMPGNIAANTNAAVIAVAEKAADLIGGQAAT